MRRITDWLTQKWTRTQPDSLIQDYQVTFSTPSGHRVLQHLMDHAYCAVYEGKDPIEMAIHNGRRSIVQEILENLDLADSPEKYRARVEGT